MSAVTLRRYTNLAAAIHTLMRRTITLLNPASWDDKNDAYFISQYIDRKPAKSLLALCFAEALETYHHWKIFSHGSDGVCLEFDKGMLLQALQRYDGLQAQAVTYKRIDEVRNMHPCVDELPFLKRHPYQDEKEFRLVYEDRSHLIESKEFGVPLECIQKVKLSPWLAPNLSKSVRATLRRIEGCENIKIHQSQLINYEQWKRVARGDHSE